MESESLGGTIVLIDSLVGPTELDLQMVEWLDHIDLPYRFVATKSDKVRSQKVVTRQELTANWVLRRVMFSGLVQNLEWDSAVAL